MARPAFYINSQWNGPTKPIVELKKPWERLKYRKAKVPPALSPIFQSLRTLDRSHNEQAFAYVSDLIRRIVKQPDSKSIVELMVGYEDLTGNELYPDLRDAISQRPVESQQAFIRELMDFFNTTKDSFDAFRFSQCMLGLTFAKAKRFSAKNGLSLIQREVLACLAKRKRLWKDEPDLSTLMKDYGLPDSCEKLVEMLSKN